MLSSASKVLRKAKHTGMSIAMLFPVEIAVDRPEEVVEVRELVSHFGNDRQGFVEFLGLVVGGRGKLLLQRILLLQNTDGFAQLIGLS